jgi:hypothetical protein
MAIQIDCKPAGKHVNHKPTTPSSRSVGHLWNFSGHISRVWQEPQPQELTDCQDAQTWPVCPWTHSSCSRTSFLPPDCTLSTIDPDPNRTTWLRGRNELSGQLSDGVFQSRQMSNRVMVLNRLDRDRYPTMTSMPWCFTILFPPNLQFLLNLTWLFTIANIANRASHFLVWWPEITISTGSKQD